MWAAVGTLVDGQAQPLHVRGGGRDSVNPDRAHAWTCGRPAQGQQQPLSVPNANVHPLLADALTGRTALLHSLDALDQKARNAVACELPLRLDVAAKRQQR